MDQPQGTHFYLIVAEPFAGEPAEMSGTLIPGPNATRYDILMDLRTQISKQMFGNPAPDEIRVTTFVLELNKIGA